MNKQITFGLFAPAIALLFAGSAVAATLGTDNASQPAYDSGWTTGTDGAATGNGFAPWTLTTSGDGFSGFFIGNSTSLASPGADINTAGESFGMYANGGTNPEALALRAFDGGALSNGQTFSITLAVNFRNGDKGIDLRDSGGITLFNFKTRNDDYLVYTPGGGDNSIGNTYSDNSAFTISITQTDGTGGTWKVDRAGGVTDSDSGTYTGVATDFQLYVRNTGGGDQSNLFANNLSVVPEPTSAVLLGCAGLAVLFRRRRSY